MQKAMRQVSDAHRKCSEMHRTQSVNATKSERFGALRSEYVFFCVIIFLRLIQIIADNSQFSQIFTDPYRGRFHWASGTIMIIPIKRHHEGKEVEETVDAGPAIGFGVFNYFLQFGKKRDFDFRNT